MTPLRQAIRALRAAPVFTVTALATLAICLGASLTIFALVDAVLLRPLPYPEADRLVTMYHASSTNARPRTGATPSVAKNSGATRPSRSRDVAPVSPISDAAWSIAAMRVDVLAPVAPALRDQPDQPGGARPGRGRPRGHRDDRLRRPGGAGRAGQPARRPSEVG